MDPPVRILLTTPTYPPFNSGVGNAVKLQADELARRGHEVVVATGGAGRSSDHSGGVQVERFAVDGARTLRNPIRGDVAGYRRFVREAKAEAVVMHAWQTWSTDLALPEVSGRRSRAFVYSHCVSTNTWLYYRPLQSLMSYLLWRPYWLGLAPAMRRLTGVIFLADDGDERFDDLRLARHIGVPVHIVPNAVDTGEAIDAERGQLIAVGSYTKAKGFDFVLEAYAQSSARNTLPLVLFGQETTPYTDELRSLARSLGVEGRVQFRVGVAGQALREEYARSKLMLFGSYTECQPLALLDAMAAGTPFIAKSTGCIAQLRGGMPVSTPAQAATEIDRLLADASAWEEASRAGRRAATDDHALGRNVDRLLAVIDGGAAR